MSNIYACLNYLFLYYLMFIVTLGSMYLSIKLLRYISKFYLINFLSVPYLKTELFKLKTKIFVLTVED